MENNSIGVPRAAWPFHSDQPRNAVRITQLLKVGLNVKEYEDGDLLILRCSAVAKAIRKLMASNEGNQMRQRAEELGVTLQKFIAEDGVSREITRQVLKEPSDNN